MTQQFAAQLVRGVARYGLVDEGLGAVPDNTWPAVLQFITEQRLSGHAVVAERDHALELTPRQLDELLDRHEEQLALDLAIERLLVRCDEELAAASIETRVLKGPATAHRFYGDPSLRSFGDGDLLVRGADMDATIRVLAGLGLERRFAAPSSSFDRRFVKAVALVGDDGLELDLHRALTPGPFGVLFDVEEVFGAAADFVRIGGRQMRCLSPELALVHACAHAALGDPEPRFVPMRDIVQLLGTAVDHRRAVDLFTRFRAEIVARRAVDLADHVLGVTLSGDFADWARHYVGSRVDRWRLGSYSGTANRYRAQAAATFWVLPTFRERLSYASALAFPTRSYLHSRDGSYPRRIARGAALVWRGRPR